MRGMHLRLLLLVETQPGWMFGCIWMYMDVYVCIYAGERDAFLALLSVHAAEGQRRIPRERTGLEPQLRGTFAGDYGDK